MGMVDLPAAPERLSLATLTSWQSWIVEEEGFVIEGGPAELALNTPTVLQGRGAGKGEACKNTEASKQQPVTQPHVGVPVPVQAREEDMEESPGEVFHVESPFKRRYKLIRVSIQFQLSAGTFLDVCGKMSGR
ncbi:hypothetical protein JOB18_008343 [Solea senegalensis]|uniref:Uncharacterized protein n=1 Tax=Solea senegalensis TaxID=28829 RepID=A0AAV6S1S3_SOLSE|nr:hypothetical protein JOB18_008343 [Solea senegalensis]